MTETRMNAERFDFGVGNQFTTDFGDLTYYDTFVNAIDASNFDNDEHVFVLYKKTGDLENEIQTGVLDEVTLRYYGATDSEIAEILRGDINEELPSTLMEEKIMENNDSYDHIKANAAWRTEEIKIKEGSDAFQEQDIKDFGEDILLIRNLDQINEKIAPLHPWSKNLMVIVNEEDKSIELVIRQKSDRNPLKAYDNDTLVPVRLMMFNNEIDMTERDKDLLLKRDIDFEAMKKIFSEVGVSKELRNKFREFNFDIKSERVQAMQLLTSASVTPEKFVQCIDDSMIAPVHYQSGNNRSLSNAAFSDGFNNFYRFINDDDLIKNMLELELSSEAIQSLFEMAEIEDLTDYEGLADYLAGDPDEMLGIVKESYIEVTEQFGIVRNQTTSSYQLDDGDVEKYHITQLKDFEEEMSLKSGTLVDHYDFEIGSFDEVLNLDKAELPHITEESSLDTADYVTYNENGELIFFSAYQIDFAGNSKVLDSIELNTAVKALYDVFEEFDLNLEKRDSDSPSEVFDVLDDQDNYIAQKLEAAGLASDKVEVFMDGNLTLNFETIAESEMFDDYRVNEVTDNAHQYTAKIKAIAQRHHEFSDLLDDNLTNSKLAQLANGLWFEKDGTKSQLYREDKTELFSTIKDKLVEEGYTFHNNRPAPLMKDNPSALKKETLANQEFLTQSTDKDYCIVFSDGVKYIFYVGDEAPKTIEEALNKPMGIKILPSDNSSIPFTIENTENFEKEPVGMIAHNLKTNRVDIEAINPNVPSAETVMINARNTKIAELVSVISDNRPKGQIR